MTNKLSNGQTADEFRGGMSAEAFRAKWFAPMKEESNEMKALAVKKGKVQLQEVTYNADGTSNVKPVSGWLPLAKTAKRDKILIKNSTGQRYIETSDADWQMRNDKWQADPDNLPMPMPKGHLMFRPASYIHYDVREVTQ